MLLVVDESARAHHAKVRQHSLLAEHLEVRRLKPQRRVGQAVDEIYSRAADLTPEPPGQVRPPQQAAGYTHDCTAVPLRDAVLLGGVGCRKFLYDAGLLAVIPKVPRTVFPTAIRGQKNHSAAVRDGQVFNKTQKRVNGFRLATNQVECLVPSQLISKFCLLYTSPSPRDS